ncbi:SpoIIE family protein phosphatase [Streptomyces sp. NPDC014806]|uniref:SpoIIE family protein phosphatase n=1 Tax=Streptomyces sp. NPDC014806 TaxID=3364920 RepID=UPI0036FFBF80
MAVAWDDIGGLFHAHERFLAGARVDAHVRGPVLESWKRCRSAGLEPHQLLISYTPDLSLDERFLLAADPVLRHLVASLAEAGTTVVLCDAHGRIVQRLGGDRRLRDRLDEVRFAPGFDASEPAAGTNGVGTALAGRGPFYVAGREHFADCLQPFACAGAPVRDPLSGRVEAVLDLTCLRGDGDPAMLRLVGEAVRGIEARLLELATARERALLAAYRSAGRPGLDGDGPHAPGPPGPSGPPGSADGAGLGAGDLALLREKAEELIAEPHRTLDQVLLSGGRIATLLRREVTGAAGETGAVVEARVHGGPRLRPLAAAPEPDAVRPPSAVPPTTAPPATAAPAPAAPPTTAVPPTSAPDGAVRPPLPGAGAGPRPPDGERPAGATVTEGQPAGTGDEARAAGTGNEARAAGTGNEAQAAGTTKGSRAADVSEAAAPAPSASRTSATPSELRVVSAAQGAERAAAVVAEARGAADAHAHIWPLLVGEPGVGRLAVLARRRLELLHEAGNRIGSTLDVTRTARELAEVTVPGFADVTVVDLPDAVLRGDEPEPFDADTELRRVAVHAVGDKPLPHGVGATVRYAQGSPQARCLEDRQGVLEPVLAGRGPEPGGHSLITVPLRARGATLGVVAFHRCERPEPFEDDDLSLAQELAARAAICVDNARRFTREHTTALTLQRSLLPRGRPDQSAVEAAYRYLPAQAGVGGDWFDVIPLSGARVALVVGDVVGHGLHAAATMGRLRTAVHNFCALDLSPEDLLTHLDDLVVRLDHGEGWAAENAPDSGIVGATCLFAVYDPVSRRCTLTRAGHPLPAVAGPDGTVEFVDLPSGPPLGLGGMPFETTELELAEGSSLVLYTDGLIEDRNRDIDAGLERLRRVLARPGRAPEEICEAVLDAMLPSRPSDDVALLVARTRVLGPDQVAEWDLPADPAVVSRARTAATGRLAAWGLDDLAFTTELVVSELVTNAIRHAAGPVRLRLLRDRALICEVSDGAATSPRLRRARNEDEGGRGLFLVARLTDRWGTRHTAEGKIIWTEQRLPSR